MDIYVICCLQSEKMLLHDQVRQDLEDKIRRLEEDRHSIDISTEFSSEFSQSSNKRKKKSIGAAPRFSSPSDRRRKPVNVTDILFDSNFNDKLISFPNLRADP